MALPTTITSNVEAYHGLGGPFCNSAGTAVYVFGRLSTSTNEIQCFKATDPTSSWSGVGSNPVLANTLRQLAACQYGDTIHVVTRDAAAANSNQLRYHIFDMSTDTWTTTNELVKTTYTIAGAVDDSIVTITTRNSGAVKVVSYEGPQVLADIQRSRVYLAQNRGAGWSADIALGGSGNAHWLPQEAVTGSGNRTHFFILDNTNEDLYQRTLDSAYALEALPAAFDTSTSNQADEMVQRAVAYSASAGGTVVVGAYFNSYAPDLNSVRFSSVDTPSSLTISLDITGATDPIVGLARRTISLANDGNTVYGVFIASNSKLYLQSSQDAAAWSTPSLFLDSAVDGQVFTNIYSRGGSRKLGICYAASAIRYTEYTLAVAPSVMTDAPDHFNFVTAGATTLRLDNFAYSTTSTSRNTAGLLITATSGATLLVWASVGGGNGTISSIAVGANALTRLSPVVLWNNTSVRYFELWGLTAAPTGILTISAVIANATLDPIGLAAVTYVGQRTTATPFGGVVTGTGSDTAVASLIVSASVGNLAVFGFTYDFTPSAANIIGTGLTQRLASTGSEWPDLVIADAPGQLATTATISAASTTFWAGIGINLIQSGGDIGRVIISGRLSATDVVDKFSATGIVASVVHIGRLSATDASDTLSAPGYVLIRASMSATAAADTFSASGTVVPIANIVGRLSATGAGDTLSATGYSVVRGRVSATEAYTDAFIISGTTITPVHGSVAWTMRQDTVVINPRQPAGLTPGTLSNAGGGAGRSNKENIPWPTDLWDAREAYLLSLYPEGPTPVLEVDDTAKAWQEYEDRKAQIEALTSERAHTIIELRESPDVKTMKEHGAHIRELTAKIATLTGKQDFARFMRH